MSDKIPNTARMIMIQVPLMAAKNLQDHLAGELQWANDQEVDPQLIEQLEFVFDQLQGTQSFRCGKCVNCMTVEAEATKIFHTVANHIETRTNFRPVSDAWDKTIIEYPCTAV